MLKLTLDEAVRLTEGSYFGSESGRGSVIRKITLDSREAEEGSLFIAIKGEHADGHEYIGRALASGAICAIGERDVETLNIERGAENFRYIQVQNVLTAMRRIAAWLRKSSGIRVVAVTGSVGKTSTRQMLTCVLSKRFNCLSTQGNFNNEYGLPQTLFRLEPQHELAVLELGISRFGEMSRLGETARPDMAVYTNIGNMHLENLHDRDGVLRAKTELIAYMPSDGRLFFNGEDDKLRGFAAPLPVTYYGMDADYPIYPSEIVQQGVEKTKFTLHYYGETAEVTLPAVGMHMVRNAIAAANVAHALGMGIEEVKAGIESYTTVGHRGRIVKVDDIILLDDCYNAGPDSMRAAISALKNERGRKMALLGDMLELGSGSERLHYELGRFCASSGLNVLFTVGPLAENIAKGASGSGMRSCFHLTRDNAVQAVLERIRPGDLLLIKASRGMHFETLLDAIAEGIRAGRAGNDKEDKQN